MIQLPSKPWNEGDTFTNDTTGVEYTFDGVKWLASGGEELDLSGFATDAEIVAVEDASVLRDEVLDGKIEQESNLNTAAHLKLEDQIQWTNTHWQQGDEKLQEQIDAIEFPEADLSDYVKQSDSWDMSLGTSLGVNVLKPLDGGTPYVYYEPRDYNSTHPCGIVNRGLMQNYVQEAVSSLPAPEVNKSRITTQVRTMFFTQATQGKASFINRNGGLQSRPDSAVGIEYTISRDTSGYLGYKDWWGDDYEPLDSGYIQVIDPFTGAVRWAGCVSEVTVTGDTIRWMTSGSIYTNFPDWNSNLDYFLNLNGCLEEK